MVKQRSKIEVDIRSAECESVDEQTTRSESDDKKIMSYLCVNRVKWRKISTI